MRRHELVFVLGLGLGACGGKDTPPPVDSTALAQRRADSVLAAHTRGAQALLAEAKREMVHLLKDSTTAAFDSLVVTQPAFGEGYWPSPVVCGRMGGKPGVNGATGMTPFIYQNRMTVFVLDQSNRAAFMELRVKMCDGPGMRVLLK